MPLADLLFQEGTPCLNPLELNSDPGKQKYILISP